MSRRAVVICRHLVQRRTRPRAPACPDTPIGLVDGPCSAIRWRTIGRTAVDALMTAGIAIVGCRYPPNAIGPLGWIAARLLSKASSHFRIAMPMRVIDSAKANH
jgi:hypothetical protein